MAVKLLYYEGKSLYKPFQGFMTSLHFVLSFLFLYLKFFKLVQSCDLLWPTCKNRYVKKNFLLCSFADQSLHRFDQNSLKNPLTYFFSLSHFYFQVVLIVKATVSTVTIQIISFPGKNIEALTFAVIPCFYYCFEFNRNGNSILQSLFTMYSI